MDRIIGRGIDPDERCSRDDEGGGIRLAPETMIVLDTEIDCVGTITEGRNREIVVSAEDAVDGRIPLESCNFIVITTRC